MVEFNDFIVDIRKPISFERVEFDVRTFSEKVVDIPFCNLKYVNETFILNNYITTELAVKHLFRKCKLSFNTWFKSQDVTKGNLLDDFVLPLERIRCLFDSNNTLYDVILNDRWRYFDVFMLQNDLGKLFWGISSYPEGKVSLSGYFEDCKIKHFGLTWFLSVNLLYSFSGSPVPVVEFSMYCSDYDIWIPIYTLRLSRMDIITFLKMLDLYKERFFNFKYNLDGLYEMIDFNFWKLCVKSAKLWECVDHIISTFNKQANDKCITVLDGLILLRKSFSIKSSISQRKKLSKLFSGLVFNYVDTLSFFNIFDFEIQEESIDGI